MLKDSELLSRAALEEAFRRFNDASGKLDERYESLRLECEELRKKLAENEDKIKRTERLATLGETAAALAHEVRNPLGAIKLFLSLAKEDLADRPQSLAMLSNIDKSIESLNMLVSDILEFAKDHRLKFGPVNVHALLGAEAITFERLVDCKGAASLELNGNPFIQGDEDSLRRALYNILLNSAQATKFKGRIGIKTEDFGSGIRITITDNGPGIEPASIERLFDPFFTTKKEGTGLGLAIVRKIIEGHSGSIEVRNNTGAEFVILLPRNGRQI